MAGSLTALRRLALDARPVQSARGTGIGSYTSQLLKALDREARLDFHLVWSPDEPKPLLRNRADYWPLGKNDLLEQTALPAWLARTGAQVYHLTQNGLGWPRRSPIPFVLTLHDLIPYRLPEVVRPSYLTRFLTEVPESVVAARKIITVSEAARADICGIFDADPGKVAVVPSAPAAVFHPRDRDAARSLLARRYGLRGPFILYVGGHNQRKNVASLVWAFARLVRSLPERQRLVLLGAGGPNCDRLAALAAALGIEREVVFPGFVPRRHLPLFYTAADLFCYPSFYEGFGLPPLEAMACGTPVVAADSSSLPEVLGDAAILVPPEDTAALSRAMLTLLSDQALAAEYRKRGLARAALYRWDDIARKVLGVYEEAILG